MTFEDALKETEDGIIIDVEVTPGSKKICIPSGYNPWRKRVEVKLSENAQKGKANEQLIENFASLFGLRTSDISITNGQKNTKKSILLSGIERARVVYVLKEGLEGKEN